MCHLLLAGSYSAQVKINGWDTESENRQSILVKSISNK